MRRILLVLLILAALAIAGLAVFIATFDANRYRPMLVAKMQEALGRPVRLDSVNLGWHGGLALRLDGLSVYEDAEARREPAIAVERTTALVRLAPLLHREIQIAAIVLKRPRILASRDAEGRINLLGLAAAASPAAAPSQAPASSPASFSIASFRIEDGAVRWTDALAHPPLTLSIRALTLTATDIALGRPMDIHVSCALASQAPNVELRGRFTPPGPGQAGSLEQMALTVTRVPVHELVASSASGEPQLQGHLSLTVEGQIGTLAPERLKQSVSADGSLRFEDGVIKNLNVLRVVLERFTMLPGLVEILMAKLPQGYRDALAQPDTALKPMALRLQVRDGVAALPEFSAGAEQFTLTGSGTVGLDGAVQIRSTLRVEPQFTAMLVKGVSELQALANANGELEVPVVLQGALPAVRPAPDMQFVASRLVVGTAADLLGKWLSRKEQQGQPAQSQPESGQPQSESTPPTPEQLLSHWLHRRQ